MPNINKISKEYLIDYLKRKDMILLLRNGVIIEPDELDKYIESNKTIINFHA